MSDHDEDHVEDYNEDYDEDSDEDSDEDYDEDYDDDCVEVYWLEKCKDIGKAPWGATLYVEPPGMAISLLRIYTMVHIYAYLTKNDELWKPWEEREDMYANMHDPYYTPGLVNYLCRSAKQIFNEMSPAMMSRFLNGNEQDIASAVAPLNSLFDSYRDQAHDEKDQVQMDGTMRYFQDVGVNVEDISMLVISELLSCPTMGEMRRSGFLEGWVIETAWDIRTQKNVIASRVKKVKTNADDLFTKVYKHTFTLGLPPGARIMGLDEAVEFWKVLFGPGGFHWVGATGTPWLEWWIESVTSKKRAVNRDLWNQTLRVAHKVLEDETLGWWNEQDSWPSQVDEFVLWAKSEKGVGKTDGMDIDG